MLVGVEGMDMKVPARIAVGLLLLLLLNAGAGAVQAAGDESGTIILKCADKVHSADWGGTTYRIEVCNNGTKDTEVVLTLSGPSGWKYYLDWYNVTVPAGTSVFVTLTVIPPISGGCDEVGVVTVTGRVPDVPSVGASVTTNTMAPNGILLEMYPQDSEVLVNPGNTTVFRIIVSNCWNMAGGMNVSLSLNSSSPDWAASLETNLVTVAGGETKRVNLTVTAPAGARAGSRLVARVLGRISEWNVTGGCTVTAIVNQIRAIKLSATPDTVELRPKERAVCDFNITNNGNGDEQVRPAIPKAPDDVAIVLEWQNESVIGENDWTSLEPGASAGFRAKLAAASGCLIGDRIVPIQLLFSNGTSMPFEMKLRVDQKFGVEIRAAEPRRTCAPGGLASFDLVCENDGNGFDNVTVDLAGLPAGWPKPRFIVHGNESNGNLALSPFGQGQITIAVAIPAGQTFNSLELNATARSSGGVSGFVLLSLDVRLPDLIISSVQYSPKKLTPGKLVTITVGVSNFGDIPAENVTVLFYENNKVIASEKLERVPGGSKLAVSFIWLPHGGNIELKFVVDPDNHIIESDEKNNNVIEHLRLSNPEPSSDWSVCWVVLLSLVVLGITLFLIRKRK